MKANEAPEKIYVKINHPISEEYTEIIAFEHGKGIEYTRTDASIEKAWDWIEDNLLSSNQQDKSHLYFEQFKRHIEGE